MITVPEVMAAMGVEHDAKIAWSVGARVRDLYEARTGSLPAKDLRPKTDGSGGTHCFALYPDDWRATIEDMVRSHGAESARQGVLL